ncbi:MAG TPA: glyceraldehyde 3-phosphate dehydrogenase NAD-binding domain-containing protein, partial [Thermoanaerobaculia bacterium]|nr:glyceraldehyde 3-phosphate dehydrogenase NAD-binding domain-containing protein [Thermoanaerobaculia bacterium]
MLSVGIFGFGRIGRNLFRLLYDRRDVEIGGIADLAEPKPLEYLVRFDSVLGRFPEPLRFEGGRLRVRDRAIPVIAGKTQPAVPDWSALGVETVFESTSRGRTRAELERHLAAGARRVIALAPPVEPV